MKKLIIITMLLAAVTGKAETIVGLTLGVGNTGATGSSSSSSSVTQTGHGHGPETTNTDINNYGVQAPPSQVVGVIVLQQIGNSDLFIGAMAQTNQTYSYLFTVRFK